MPRGIDRAEHLREEIGIGQILLRDCSHGEVKIQIDDAIRLDVGVKNLCPFNLTQIERQTLCLCTDVRPCENGNRRKSFLRIRCLLRLFECRTGVQDLCNLLGTHRGLFLRKDLLLYRLALLSECTARRKRHERLMRILEECLADHLLEVTVFQSPLELGKHILIAEIVLRRSIVEPRLHHADAVDQPLRRGTEIRFAQTELKGIECCLD